MRPSILIATLNRLIGADDRDLFATASAGFRARGRGALMLTTEAIDDVAALPEDAVVAIATTDYLTIEEVGGFWQATADGGTDAVRGEIAHYDPAREVVVITVVPPHVVMAQTVTLRGADDETDGTT